MTTEEKQPVEEKKADEEKLEEEEKTKTAETVLASKIDEMIAKFDVTSITKKLDEFGDRIKALETPTDLPARPKVQAEDDIGAKIKTPDTYQSNSQQASIRDSDPKNSITPDKAGLSMQEKSTIETPVEVEKSLTPDAAHTYTTQTPRPNAAIETINKGGLAEDFSPVLKAARENGFDALNVVAHDILKGKFYTPTEEERELYGV